MDASDEDRESSSSSSGVFFAEGVSIDGTGVNQIPLSTPRLSRELRHYGDSRDASREATQPTSDHASNWSLSPSHLKRSTLSSTGRRESFDTQERFRCVLCLKRRKVCA